MLLNMTNTYNSFDISIEKVKLKYSQNSKMEKLNFNLAFEETKRKETYINFEHKNHPCKSNDKTNKSKIRT